MKTSKPLTCESGFGVVGLIALLPLLIGVLAVISAGAMLLKADARLKHECRTSVLNSQRSVSENLRRLLALNPQAEELREERLAAEEAVEVAEMEVNPQLLLAAQTYLSSVKVRQGILATEQKVLIVKARANSWAAPMRAKSAVTEGLVAEAQANGVGVPNFSSHSRAGSFDVVAKPEGDPTPDYTPSPRFTDKQTVDVDVDIELGPLLPDWLRSLLPTQGLKVNTHCQATIEKQEDTWIETLSAAR